MLEDSLSQAVSGEGMDPHNSLHLVSNQLDMSDVCNENHNYKENMKEQTIGETTFLPGLL